MRTLNILSKEDIEKIIKSDLEKFRAEIYENYNRLLDRMADLEQIIKIYGGKLKIEK